MAQYSASPPGIACSIGGQATVTQGLLSSGTQALYSPFTPSTGTGVVASYPSCTVTVYLTGTSNLATIYSNVTGTPLTNPFTANNDGSLLFYAASGNYDVTISGATLPNSFTFTDVGIGTSGGGGGAYLPLAGGTMSGVITTLTPTSASGGLVLPPGVSPTSPPNGTVWTTSAGLFAQINGATVGPYGTGGSNFLPLAGGTLTGKLITSTPTISASGLNLPPGTAPSAPVNGDIWTTSAGLYAQINGATVGPFGATTLTLQTNGTPNSSQTLLNLVAGTNVSLSATGGAVTISASNSASAAWSAIANPSGNLSLTMGSNTSAFTYSSAVAGAFQWANSTAANSGTAQSSPTLTLTGNCWTGSATATDVWTIQDVVANGSAGKGVLTFTPSGGCGYRSVSVPNLVTAGNIYATSTTGGMTGAFSSLGAGATLSTQNANNWHAEGPYGGSAVSQTGTMVLIFASGGLLQTSFNGGSAQTVAYTTSSITGNAATATAFATTPTQCSSGNVSTGVQASGNANCTAAGNTNSTSLTAGVFPQASGANAIINSSPQLDNGVTTPNTVTYAGSGGYAVQSTVAGVFTMGPGTAAPTVSAGVGWAGPTTVATPYNAVVPSVGQSGYFKASSSVNQTGCTASSTNLCSFWESSISFTNDVSAITLATGTTVSLTAPREDYVCTSTCAVTPPVPAAGYEFCVLNDDNVSTVITLEALGSSARYETTARTGYGTAGTGTFTSGGAVGDKMCLLGRDATHYLVLSFVGTWTAS